MGKYDIEQYKCFQPFFAKNTKKTCSVLVKIQIKEFYEENLFNPLPAKQSSKKQMEIENQKQQNQENTQNQLNNYNNLNNKPEKEINDSKNESIQNQVNENNEVNDMIIKKKNDLILKTLQNLKRVDESQVTDQEELESQKQQNDEFRKRIKGFGKKRYFLFSKYDEGIQMDLESWYSVIPETIAYYISQRLLKCKNIMDGFCGIGGLGIQLGQFLENVVINDIDENKINMAKHNAKIYGVQDKIIFTNRDFLKIEGESKDCLIICPPWGGTNYFYHIYDLKTQIKPDFQQILIKSFEISQNIFMQLPKNIDIIQLIDMITEALETNKVQMKNMRLEFEIVKINDKINQILVYFGDITIMKQQQELEALYNIMEIEDNDKKQKFKQKLLEGKARDIYSLIAQNLEFEDDYIQYISYSAYSQKQIEENKKSEMLKRERAEMEKMLNQEKVFIIEDKQYDNKKDYDIACKKLKNRKRRLQRKEKKKENRQKQQNISEDLNQDKTVNNCKKINLIENQDENQIISEEKQNDSDKMENQQEKQGNNDSDSEQQDKIDKKVKL